MVTEEDYTETEEQFMNMTDNELGALARSAAEEQPALFVYIASYYDCLQEDDNKDFFIQMIYSTWIAYNHKYELKRKLTVDDLEKMEEADERLMNEISVDEEANTGEAFRRMTEHPQAVLISGLYSRIADYFGLEGQNRDDEENGNSFHDAGVISGVAHSFVNLLEKTRQVLYIS